MAHGSGEGVESDQGVVRKALQTALACLSLDTAPTMAAPSSAFFKGAARQSALSIRPSKDYIEELQKTYKSGWQCLPVVPAQRFGSTPPHTLEPGSSSN